MYGHIYIDTDLDKDINIDRAIHVSIGISRSSVCQNIHVIVLFVWFGEFLIPPDDCHGGFLKQDHLYPPFPFLPVSC